LILHFLPFVVFLLPPFRLGAEDSLDHPVIERKDIKRETCLTCHPEKNEGRFVHTAVRMGCPTCHQITSERNKTTITLFAPRAELCSKCHEARKDPVLHGPYKNGQCLICHDPHSSPFKAQTRSSGNSLCLECHAPKRVTTDSVSLFNLQEISKSEFEAIPKIELDATMTFGHPCATHPVAEVADPLRGSEKMSCLSCHTPHASTLPNLLVLAKGSVDVCEACHRAIDKRREVNPNRQPQPKSPRTPILPTQFSGIAGTSGGDPCAQ
jgi:predicted CXXCH cytochrome family protein